MLKKLFKLSAIFASFSVACFILILFYKKDANFDILIQRYDTENGTLFREIKGRIEEFMKKEDNSLKINKKTEIPTSNVSAAASKAALKACPDTPPKLVGPLQVDFSTKRTLDEVRNELKGYLLEGGRSKPTECITKHKVAIIIPFRNRHEHLIHWLHYLHPILRRQQLDYGVYVINQDGDGIFNRAKLMNVGFVEAQKQDNYECFVFSDIDLVPIDDRNLYRCFDNPRHLAVAMDKFNFHLPYNTYFGGVSSLSKTQYMRINGFPNTYWGWGGEDDDIYKRIVFRGMSISRPDSVIGKYKMVKHKRDKHNEPNPKNPDKLGHTRLTMDKDGINSLKYTVKKIEKDFLYTFITVDVDAPKS